MIRLVSTGMLGQQYAHQCQHAASVNTTPMAAFLSPGIYHVDIRFRHTQCRGHSGTCCTFIFNGSRKRKVGDFMCIFLPKDKCGEIPGRFTLRSYSSPLSHSGTGQGKGKMETSCEYLYQKTYMSRPFEDVSLYVHILLHCQQNYRSRKRCRRHVNLSRRRHWNTWREIGYMCQAQLKPLQTLCEIPGQESGEDMTSCTQVVGACCANYRWDCIVHAFRFIPALHCIFEYWRLRHWDDVTHIIYSRFAHFAGGIYTLTRLSIKYRFA